MINMNIFITNNKDKLLAQTNVLKLICYSVNTITHTMRLMSQIRWWKSTEDYKQTHKDLVVEKVDEAYITGLEKGHLYKLRINALNSGGDGKLSPVVYFTMGKYLLTQM